MSWQIDTITLPISPTKVTDTWETERKIINVPDSQPIVVTIGRRRTLELEGYIYVAGQTSSQIETTYLIPLRNKVGSVVTVSAPDTRYDSGTGLNYVMESFTYEQVPGSPNAFRYKMRLIGCSTAVTL